MKFRALLIATMAGFSLSAMANTTATDSMYINDFSITQGDSVLVAYNWKNATGYAASQGDLTFAYTKIYPVKHYDSVTQSDVYFEKASRMENFSLADLYHADKNMIRFVHFDMSNRQIAAGDGPIMYIYIKCDSDAVPGVYEGTITKTHFSTGLVDEQYANDGDGPDTSFKVTVVENSGVNDVNVSKTVANVRYYNIAGQASATPFDGINVVETIYTDGSKSVSKQILK